MKKFISSIFFTFFLTITLYPAFADENLKLVLALDLVRHGDRNPKKYIPQISNAWSKDEIKKITPLGKQQAELLGKNFREYYIDKTNLLPQKFSLELIQANSTNSQRTKETAKALLKGMFPNHADKISIATYHILNPKDKEKNISIIKKLRKDKTLSKTWFIPEIMQKLKYINRIFGTNFSTIHEYVPVADLIKVSKIHNKPLLKKLPAKQEQEIISLNNKSKLKLLTYPKIACLYGKNFIIHVMDILQSQSTQKYFLFAGHDNNIITLTSLLGYDLKNKPPYLSNLKFEVFQNEHNKNLFIKTSLDGRIIKVCKSINICPLKEFITTLQNNIKNKCNISGT
ncbi:MAG: histidine-type phosphatase [Rickettsiales bacterium]|nr:histidine-type phosphatase [Rickettsiales bacterium]